MHYLKEELYRLIKSDDKIFDFLQQSSLDGLWYWDLTDQAHEWMNEQFWITLGYDPAEQPHLASAWQDIINPEDLQKAIERVGQHLADPTVPYDQVVRYRHKEGHTVWIRCRGMAIRNEQGEATRLLGAHVDITQEKEKEALLEKSNRIARIGTWEVDFVKQKITWNEVTKEIHEVPEDFEPDLKTAINFYQEGSSRETITRLLDRAVTEGTPFDTELQLVTAQQNSIWVRAMGEAEIIDGVCQRVSGIFQDINQRKLQEDRLLNYSILEAKSKEMEQFAYIASHDLREPLLTITGYLDVIQEDHAEALPAAVEEYLATIKGAALRMDTLIKGLLDYSRLSKIKQLQEVDLMELTRHVIADLDSIIRPVAAQITYQNLPIVAGYPLELKVLIQNLLSNAIKYRKVAEQLHIQIECQDTKNGWQLSIKDNGIGIHRKDLEAIFQLFRQLHEKGTYSGNGIGLANCKKIVELHNGSIWAASELGQGTTFYFTIETK